MSLRFRLAAGVLLAGFWMSSAGAQQVCIDPATGRPDPFATQNWQSRLPFAEVAAADMLIGTWYTEATSPTGQVAQTQITYEPGGNLTVLSRTCAGTCLDDSGHGTYYAIGNADGTVYAAAQISTLYHPLTCIGGTYRVTADALVGIDGTIWRRVR